jgi:hypothetical protein
MSKKFSRALDEIDPETNKPGQMSHRVLNVAHRHEIADIHAALADVLVAPGDAPMSLEQFELDFMRADNLDDEIRRFRAVALALQRIQNQDARIKLNRTFIYQRLILTLAKALKDSERAQEITYRLFQAFVWEWVGLGGELKDIVAADTDCQRCFQKIDVSSANFCSHCGHRLNGPLEAYHPERTEARKC